MQVGVGCRRGGTTVGNSHSFEHRLVSISLTRGTESAARGPTLDSNHVRLGAPSVKMGVKAGNVLGMPRGTRKLRQNK